MNSCSDGEPIPVTAEMQKTSEKSENINIEFWSTESIPVFFQLELKY
jgi:hypothetical protein